MVRRGVSGLKVVNASSIKVDELETALKEKEKSEAELKENVSQLTETLQRTVSGVCFLRMYVRTCVRTFIN